MLKEPEKTKELKDSATRGSKEWSSCAHPSKKPGEPTKDSPLHLKAAGKGLQGVSCLKGFSGASGSKGPTRLQCRRPRFDPWVRKIPQKRKWQSVLIFLLWNP